MAEFLRICVAAKSASRRVGGSALQCAAQRLQCRQRSARARFMWLAPNMCRVFEKVRTSRDLAYRNVDL